MLPIYPVSSEESPREILEEDFPRLRGQLPISGGWGYTKSDACIIDKNDPLFDSLALFDLINIERIFVSQRIYEEMIIFRPNGEKFSDIKWDLQQQELIHDDDKVYDRLIFEVTAFTDNDWEELKAEFEGASEAGSTNFDMDKHEKKRQEKTVRLIREFWFDITSTFNS